MASVKQERPKSGNVKLMPEAHSKLVGQAKRERRTIRVVLETALDQYVERYENENPIAKIKS